MQSTMLKAIVEDFGNGGTIDGDLVVSGDLQVSGGGSLSFDEIVQGTQVIDVDNTEALLVRKDGDGGDVFIVDTTNSRVGVGIAPSHELTVNNQIGIKRDGTDAFGTLTFDSSGLVLDQSASGYSPLKIKSNGSEIARFTSTGLGIGVTSNSVALHVSGDMQLDDSAPFLLFKETGSNKDMQFKLQNDGRMSLLNDNASTEVLTVLQSGSVGIGGSPDTLLNLKNTGGIELRLEADTNNSGQEDCFIRFYTDGKSQEGIAGMDNNNSSTLFGSNTENAMVFGTVSNLPTIFATNNTERVHISADGNVGIGTTPSYLLHVAGQADNDLIAQIQNTEDTDGRNYGLRLRGGSTSADYSLSVEDHDGANVLLRVRGDGNVGIATSSPAQGQSTPISNIKLDVAGNQMLSNLSSTNSDESKLFFFRSDGAVGSQGAVPDGLKIGAIEWTALTSGDNNNSITSARIEVEAGSTWSSASNRNADITFSTVGANTLAERMRINSTGVGIGTDTNDSKAKFQVEGSTTSNQDYIFRNNDATASSRIIVNSNDVGFNAQLVADAGNSFSWVGSSTGGTNRIVFPSGTNAYFEGGNFGFGVSDPDSELEIFHATDPQIKFSINTHGDAGIILGDADGVKIFGKGASNEVRLYSGASTIALRLDDNSRISLSNNDSGAGNTVFGELAGNALASGGNYNLLIGKEAGNDLTTSDHNVAIGFQTLSKATANLDGNTAVGNYAMGSVVSNDVNNCTAIGYASMSVGVLEAGASGTVAVGFGTLDNLTSGAGNIAVGYLSGNAMTTGARNLAIGYQSLYQADVCDDSIAIGYQSLGGTDAGSNTKNIAIGNYALDANLVNSVNNVAIGYNALTSATSGQSNVAIGGSGAGGAITTADRIVAIGDGALGGAVQSQGNTGVGYACLYNATGEKNTAFGYQSSNTVTDGTQNTVIGWDADVGASGAVNQTVIGSETTGQGDNTVTLGNSNVTSVLCASDGEAQVYASAIRFPATQISNGNANALDDYEEGTFTVDNNSDSTGTISAETGEYVKIGSMVHVRIVVTVSANFASNTFSGLPFTCNNSASPSSLIGGFGVLTGSGGANESITASPGATSTNINLFDGNNAGDTHLPNTTHGTYRMYLSYMT